MKLSKQLVLHLILFNIASLFIYSQNISSKNSKKLRFDGVYVYDNGKDTIVKDYEAYRALINSNMVPESIVKKWNPADSFVPGPGSTQLEYLKFFPNGRGVAALATKRNYNEAIRELQLFLQHNDYDQIFYYSVFNDSILSINRGMEVKRTLIKYNGYIKNDSLILNLEIVGGDNKAAYSQGDSIRSYKFIKNVK